uniref:Uncharacterized protein n=1 Tax=Oryza punctata TaxID=4537 RepID=A0A0E0JEI2_ORYPU
MLPVSTVVDEGVLEPVPADDLSKTNCGKSYRFWKRKQNCCPFELAQSKEERKLSLEEIKEMWTRMLVYAAGKCSGELYARQLGDGLELLTFVWLLMIRHGLGDAATEVKLLTSDDPSLPELWDVVALFRK